MTEDQAKEYLTSIGISLPAFMLTLIISKVETVNDCLIKKGYSETDAALIKLYLLGVFGILQGDNYLLSRRAPNGAAQSFRIGTMQERYRAAVKLLQSLDVHGCTDGILPSDPNGANAAAFVGVGGCL